MLIREVEGGRKGALIATMLEDVLVGEDAAVEEEVKGAAEVTVETRRRKMEQVVVEADRTAQCHHVMAIT